MNIGLYDPYLSTLGGGEKYILTAASCLAKNNNVFIFWNPLFEQEIKSKAKEKLGIDLSDIKFVENIFDKNISLSSRLIKSRKFDYIIFLSDGSIPFVASKLIIHFQFPVEWLKVNVITKIKLKRARRIVCNSRFTKAYIDKKFKLESDILYPPVLIKKIDTKKENIVLHVGRFGQDEEGANFKKQDIMINAFKNLSQNNDHGWRFVLIISVAPEDQDKASQLKEMAKGFPIDIVENPTNKVLWEMYNKSKIYWHASGYGEDLQNQPQKAEHFGISTVEAMGAGNVPVVINAGGQKEIVEDKKSGYLWNNTKQLQSYTKELMKNSSLLGKMSKEAIKRSKVFSGERFCKELARLIE